MILDLLHADAECSEISLISVHSAVINESYIHSMKKHEKYRGISTASVQSIDGVE